MDKLDILSIGIIGLLVGVLGTGAGGVVTSFLGKPGEGLLSVVLGFAGCIMLSVVFLDLIPEAFAVGGVVPSMVGIFLGTLVIMALDLVLPHTHFFSESEEGSRYVKTGMVLGLGIAMHNLPEGLAIGSGYTVGIDTGVGLAIAMALHNIPEGMAMATPMVIGGVDAKKVILWTGAAGLPMGVGAFLGALIGNLSPMVLAISLGFAAGAMLYIVFDEMIPDAQQLAQGHSGTFGGVAGVLAGIVLAVI